ncbi:hypothetical protein THAOC_26798 [Thalassiosira oceanica]|uniref:Uncharacterized protein n=1 Tax=Thalassiosira oceanica TaxID=159749 RepID=K0RY24_THAOC|nr:hypothetical protein THAOC_26798 [Thalassiosira oceanica]|eukprot:EJK53706.1 hypothetical protein THAOC_26798 [Thalassiosira oceanica]
MRGAISELGKALKSPKLKSLTWYRNPIGSVEDMNLFTRALSQSNALDELTFMWNSNENAFQRTKLNDDDAVLIAQSLGGNTHLRKLHLGNNNIQERGMRALYEAVNDTSTLNALSDSNHSCHLRGLSEYLNLYAINSDQDSNGLYTNRICKIHKLIVKRYRNGGGNVPHLNTEMRGGDSVLLAPYLMESVVRRHDSFQKRYNESIECLLGLLYELVKDWKMAELFSFR